MVSALLVSLREGLEAALVVGICLAYLRKIERRDLERPVWAAVAAAVLASLAGAVLLERFAWNQEAFEGLFMLAAAALLVTMIVWMRRVARTLRRQIEGEVDKFAGRTRFAALGLFLFVFVMVLREGVETVLLLGAVALNTEGLAMWAGTALGLAVAVALAVFFFQGTLPIPLHRFFDATRIMLIVIAAQLTLSGLHELSESGLVPSGPAMMRLLGPIVRNEVFFFAILLATAAWLVGRELLHWRAAAPASLSAQDRVRHEAEQRRQRRWMAAAAVTASAVLVALAAERVYARAELAPLIPVQAASETVRIPVAQVNDGQLYRFRFTGDRTTIRFLVIRRPDGRLATALEACTICGAHGYFLQDDTVVCQNCAAAIPVAFLDTPGGCNPVPIRSWVEGEELVIPLSELEGGARFFARP